MKYLLLLSLLSGTFIKAQSRTDSVYLFSYFINNGEDGLHMAYSGDGLQYTSMHGGRSLLTPEVGKDKLMRDPCVIRGSDGLFHMVWTVSWNDKGIGYATTKDFKTWSEQMFLPIMMHEDSARNTWAPEITYDPYSKQYMIYWASTVNGRYTETAASESKYNHRMYYTLTKDFKTFSPTKLLYNKGFNVIDATIVVLGRKKYLMVMKDETLFPIAQKNLRIARSKHFNKGYAAASPPITGKYWAEGPTTLKIKDQWIVLFDKYADHKYGAVASTDLTNWSDISDAIQVPAGLRHGTVFMVSAEEFETFFGKD